MSFREDNDEYDAWLAAQCRVVKKDVATKHLRMKKNAFIFLRATYFRWARTIPALCPDLMDAPQVLGVGDTHLENFGTWRDADGRLVWGVNDFDEAAVMPYTLDLVRLATSIRLAPKLDISNAAAAEALLKGYREGLKQPQPALLHEGETWLRPYAERPDAGRRNSGRRSPHIRRPGRRRRLPTGSPEAFRRTSKASDFARASPAAAASDGRAMSR